jgi:ribosomal protein L40E
MADVDRRCPNCGALVAVDAEWCGQCFVDLRTRRENPVASSVVSPTASVGDRAAAAAADAGRAPGEAAAEAEAMSSDGAWWPCSVCGARNPIELEACARCGTPFADLMREAPTDRASAEPKEALAWSLIFPGLGHRAVGRPLDGLSRGVLFGMSFAMALLLGFAGVRSGPTFVVFALFLLAALVAYAGSAYEAYRLASGGDLLVGSRPLLWVLVGLILLSVVMLALAVASTGGGG